MKTWLPRLRTPVHLPLKVALGAGWLAVASFAAAADLPAQPDERLVPVFQSERVWNGVATTRDGRVFVCHPDMGTPGPQIEEITPGHPSRSYPDAAWNEWKPGLPITGAFVHANGLRVGPDGSLWVIDAGAPGPGKPSVPGAARAVQIDLSTNKVVRVYPMGAAQKPESYLDDLRFHGDTAYLTDAGAPSLLVLDLKTGATRRVLDGDPSTTERRPLLADGKPLVDEHGKPILIHADQLEVSPDGKHLYYQPCSGPMSRIETRWLDDERVTPAEVARHVEPWVDTPSTGGTAIDAQGNIYLSDVNTRRVLKITPDKEVSTILADPRLIWCDALWLDDAGFLWLPASQLNRVPGLNGGKDEVRYPVWIYKLTINARPAAADHP